MAERFPAKDFSEVSDELRDGLARYCTECVMELYEDYSQPERLERQNLFTGDFRIPSRPDVPSNWRVAAWEGAESHPVGNTPRFRFCVDHQSSELKRLGSRWSYSPALYYWWGGYAIRVDVSRRLVALHGEREARARIRAVQTKLGSSSLHDPVEFFDSLLQVVYLAYKLEEEKERSVQEWAAIREEARRDAEKWKKLSTDARARGEEQIAAKLSRHANNLERLSLDPILTGNRRFGQTPSWVARAEIENLRRRWPQRAGVHEFWRDSHVYFSPARKLLRRPYYPGVNGLLTLLENCCRAVPMPVARARRLLAYLLNKLSCPKEGSGPWTKRAIRTRVELVRQAGQPSEK